jgi:glycosyltransferase involved in cell wall biosynthesis
MASIDVVIPNYQYGRYLRQCVTSVLDQGIMGVRILIIDNASTDNSIEVAQELAAQDSRIEVLARRKNLGPQASFNEGIDWASAEYFAIVCADDLLVPRALARAASILGERRDAAFAVGKEIRFVDGEPLPAVRKIENCAWRIMNASQFVEARCRELVCGPTVVRTSVQKKAGYYCAELPFTDDLEMLLRLATYGKVAETEAVQGLRRLHGSNMGALHKMDRASDLRERKAAFDHFFANKGRSLPGAIKLRQRVNRSLANRAYWWGVRELYLLDFKAARRLFSFAFRTRPETVLLPPISYLCGANGPIGRRLGFLSNTFGWSRIAQKL